MAWARKIWSGESEVGKRYYCSLFELEDGTYRLNIMDNANGKCAYCLFDGDGALMTAQAEYDKIIKGKITPVSYRFV